MTDTLLARKGQAVPTGLGSGERYALANATRRVIALGQMADTPAPLAWPEKTPAATFTAPRSAARILPRSRRAAEYRRRFTFRLHDEEHKLFCAAAAVLGCSRQKLLERALNRGPRRRIGRHGREHIRKPGFRLAEGAVGFRLVAQDLVRPPQP